MIFESGARSGSVLRETNFRLCLSYVKYMQSTLVYPTMSVVLQNLLCGRLSRVGSSELDTG